MPNLYNDKSWIQYLIIGDNDQRLGDNGSLLLIDWFMTSPIKLVHRRFDDSTFGKPIWIKPN